MENVLSTMLYSLSVNLNLERNTHCEESGESISTVDATYNRVSAAFKTLLMTYVDSRRMRRPCATPWMAVTDRM